MTEGRQGKSGLVIFTVLAIGLLGAIGGTVLMANGYRNLNRLLVHFGYQPIERTADLTIPRTNEIRNERSEPARIFIPERMLTKEVPLPAHFVRMVLRAPEALCDALREGGFPNPGWKEGGFDARNWECMSYREFPLGETEQARPSSVFLAIRGSQEARITSFRIKLNIEDAAAREAVIEAALTAIRIFLDEVRWEDAPEIFDDIRSLEEFDIVRFGNRIQLKKEFSETPRYNFLITPDRTRNRGTYLPDYFDRDRWLPLPDTL